VGKLAITGSYEMCSAAEACLAKKKLKKKKLPSSHFPFPLLSVLNPFTVLARYQPAEARAFARAG
jgi:hypothetical protein